PSSSLILRQPTPPTSPSPTLFRSRRSSAGDPADELGLKLPRPLACGGDVQRLGRGGRHNHALTERDPRRRRRRGSRSVRAGLCRDRKSTSLNSSQVALSYADLFL